MPSDYKVLEVNGQAQINDYLSVNPSKDPINRNDGDIVATNILTGSKELGFVATGLSLGTAIPSQRSVQYNDKGQPLVDETLSGAKIGCDGASNWVSVQCTKMQNPTEFIVYNSAIQGYARAEAGSNRIHRIPAPNENYADSNVNRFYDTGPFRWRAGDNFYFNGVRYVLTEDCANPNTVSVAYPDPNPAGRTVSFVDNLVESFFYCYCKGTGACNIENNIVTITSGDPFIDGYFDSGSFDYALNYIDRPYVRINDSYYLLDFFISPSQIKVIGAPNMTNVSYMWRINIADQLSTLRIQAVKGGYEENFNLFSRSTGPDEYGRFYGINSGFADPSYTDYNSPQGYEKMRPIFIGSGEYINGVYQYLLGVYPREKKITQSSDDPATASLSWIRPGYLALGGVTGRDKFGNDSGRDALRIYAEESLQNNKNRFAIRPSWAGEQALSVESDNAKDIDLALVPQGNGKIKFGQFTGITPKVAKTWKPTGYVTIKTADGRTVQLYGRVV